MTTKRFIVIVLDSFGVGAMADDKKVRPQDVQACTCGHILEKLHVRLPNLEALGLMNALGHATPEMQLNPKAAFGRAALAHDGAEAGRVELHPNVAPDQRHEQVPVAPELTEREPHRR